MIGELFLYHDWRKFDIFTVWHYQDRWSVMLKWNDGSWKSAVKIGKYRKLTVVELSDDGGIFSVDPGIIYPYDKKLKDKRWRNDDDDETSM